jgi:hypothetical protein
LEKGERGILSSASISQRLDFLNELLRHSTSAGRLAPLQIAWQEEANGTRRNQVNPLVLLSLSRVKENFDGGTTTLAAPIFH